MAPQTPQIVYEDNHLLVVVKPPMMPVQADASGDMDLLGQLKEYIRVKYNKPGEAFLGLVHRLDRPAGGLMVFARTSKAASRLSDQVRARTLRRGYIAAVEGSVFPDEGELNDWLLKDDKTNTTRTAAPDTPGAKPARLHYRVLERAAGQSLVRIQLHTGRSHQIRVQFASRGWPLLGDARYNPASRAGQGLSLWSRELALTHPTTREDLSFFALPPEGAFGFDCFTALADGRLWAYNG